MICPECGQPMTQVPCQTPINFASEIRWEKWRCERCKLQANVETVFVHYESADTSSVAQEPK